VLAVATGDSTVEELSVFEGQQVQDADVLAVLKFEPQTEESN
jgi:hypothetical protein